ncbi:SpoIIE family protein phosphatase [Streptomyces sp. 4N509B]|uniref:SpoIIE family protein phosphatase n=1 Tax=Streptomyces sp. 4N509B TaxID=3457413 RepID=UPI003FD587BF
MAGRLEVLAAAEAGLSDADVLLLALQQAVAALGGLGGMAHLRGPGPAGPLLLVVSAGLPRAVSSGWETVPSDEQSPPALALREDAAVWRPTAAALPGSASDHDRADVVAFPLPTPHGPAGTLTVLLPPAAGEPATAGLAVAEQIAGWAAGRLGTGSRTGHTMPLAGSGRAVPTDIRQALRAVRIGAWDWDVRSGDVTWTEPVPSWLDLPGHAFDGRMETWTSLIHPADLPTVMAETERAIRSHGEGEYEYRVRRADGSWAWVRTRGRVIADDQGRPTRMLGTLWDTTEAHNALESAGRALRQMSDGFVAAGGGGVITFVNPEAERLLGDGGELTHRRLWDLPTVRRVPGLAERCRAAATTGGEPDEFDVQLPGEDRWYHLRLMPVPEGLTVFLTDVTERRRQQGERAALERAAGERATRIGELTAALSEAVTAQDVVNAVADHVMSPFSASSMAVYAVEGDRLRIIDALGYDPEFLRIVDDLVPEAATAISEALNNHAPVFVESPEEYLARYPGSERLVAGSAKRSWAFLPLIVSGRGIGACVISFDHPRHLGGEERTLLVAVSGLVAQALERARLYDLEHGRARELQRGLLPRELPRLPGVTAAACYLPAGRGTEVGGDWYDVIPLAADRVALVIGDVMGHGLSEAATMGRLRTAVHTLSDLELPPDDVLTHLNDIVSDLGDEFYATCLYAVYDPTNRRCVFARAGHPPPAVVTPGGEVRFPDLDPNAPLGAAAPPFETAELELPDGALLVLYTDGLVESPGRDIDQGMAHLASVLSTAYRAGRAQSPEELSEAITTALLPAGVEHEGDDAALLVAQTHWLSPDNIATWALPEDPIAAGQARDHVREQLAAWHLDALTTTTELVASELVGNVVRHARGPIRLRLLRSRSLICEVSDGSHTTPHVRRASETDEGGRGLQLVAALSRRWGTRVTTEGKSIWTEQTLPGGQPGAAGD